MSIISVLRGQPSTARATTTRLILPAILLGSVGCMGHANFPPVPSARVSVAERRAYYQRYHAVTAEHALEISNAGSTGWSVVPVLGGMRLADGQVVQDPEDLRFAVGPRTPSWVALDRAADVQRVRIASNVLAGLASIGGIVMFVYGMAGPSRIDAAYAVTGFTLALGGSVFLGSDRMIFGGTVASERERALLFYNDSLRSQLGLCGDGTEPGDCADTAVAPGVVPDRVNPAAVPVTTAVVPITATTASNGSQPGSTLQQLPPPPPPPPPPTAQP